MPGPPPPLASSVLSGTQPLRCLVFIAVLLAGAVPLAAQSAEAERPRVEAVRFRGVSAVSRDDLQASIATQPTRCRSLAFKPFCWITDSGTFVEKHYLDRAELPRDEVRLRVFLFRHGYRQAEVTSAVEPRGDGVEVVLAIEEGPPTRTAALDVRQTVPVLPERAIAGVHLPRSDTRWFPRIRTVSTVVRTPGSTTTSTTARSPS